MRCNPLPWIVRPGWLAGIFAILLPFALFAQDSKSAPSAQKVTTVEGITEYRLPNGVRFLLFPDSSKPLVTVNMTVLVGSRHEGYGETGMAHLLEHMLFKGTPNFPEPWKSLRDHGARFNGTTWLDRTNYYETMTASDENLDFGIQLEADRLVHSYVKREDLISEMTVVRNEFEMGENNPEMILRQRMIAAAYEWHNYGKSTIGNRSDIERVPIENLQRFYRKHYQPDNIVLVVAGKFDEKKALALVEKYFGVLPKPNRSLDTTWTEEPTQDGERNVTLRRVGSVAVVGAAYHVCAGPHPDFAAVEVLANVLAMEPAGRLYKSLVETKKANRIMGFSMGTHDPGMLELYATCDPDKVEPVRQTMIETLEGMAAKPITDEEVTRARAQLLADREQLMGDSTQVAINLTEWAANGDWRLFFLHRDRLEKVSAADVNRVAQQYLRTSNRTQGVFVPTPKPERAAIPETPKVAELVKDYKGRANVAAGEAFDPTPANIDQRVQHVKIENIKAALLPKKTRNEMVHLNLVLRFGNEESLKGKITALDMLASLLERGTKKHTRQEIADTLDKLKSKISISADTGVLIATVQTKRENLAPTLDLLTEILREPSFSEKEFELLRNEMRAGLEKGRTDPIALARVALRRKIAPYPKDDVRYVPTIEESLERLKAVTVEDVKELYKSHISAQVGEVGVVGDFDKEGTVKQLQNLFKDWKSDVAYRRVPRPAHPEVPGGKEVILTPDKANAVYLAVQSFAVGDKDPEYPALELGNYVFGGSASSRLLNRVRQKEGLSYSVGSHVQASPRDKASICMMFAICNPKNIDKVDAAILDEVDKYLMSGPSLTEVTDAQKGWLEEQKSERSADSYLAQQLANNENLGRTFAFQADLEKKVSALGPTEIKDAFKKFVDPKKLIIIRAGDFQKKAEK
ncbi:MAG TPA: pitrilysin family protein [Gemmataceae bacterium]|nr:pitrilysin family protein [Gemmataceae bacterium]